MLCIVLCIVPLQQIAIDIYLPSLPAMVGFFNVNKSLLQYSLSIYIFSLGISQLLYGPLSDAFGRKKILIVGTSIFLIANIAAIFSHNMNVFLGLRLLAGIGMGCGFVTVGAIVSDSFHANDMPKVTTLMAMVYSLPPILAPVLGGYLQHYIGWQSNFIFIAVYTVLLLLLVIFKLPETNTYKEKNHFSLVPVLKTYVRMLSHFRFVSSIVCLTMAFALMIAFNVVGPFLLQNVLHVNVVNYGQLLLVIGACYLVGTILNSFLLKFFKSSLITCVGIVLMVLSSIILAIVGTTVFTVVLFTGIAILATGFVFPNTYADALCLFPEKIGSASALIGAMSLVGCTVVSIVVAQIHVYSDRPLAFIYLTISVITLVAFYFNQKSRR